VWHILCAWFSWRGPLWPVCFSGRCAQEVDSCLCWVLCCKLLCYCVTAPYCREEIASCSEAAYSSLSLADAQKLMMFKSQKEAEAYAKQVGPALLHQHASDLHVLQRTPLD